MSTQRKSTLGHSLCVLRLSLKLCRKHTHQAYSSVYKLSNSTTTTYDWPSLLTCSTVAPYLKFWGFMYLNLNTWSVKVKGYGLKKNTVNSIHFCLLFLYVGLLTWSALHVQVFYIHWNDFDNMCNLLELEVELGNNHSNVLE